MDRQLAASPQTLGSSDVGSELLGTRTTGHEQATATATILDGAGLVTAPGNGGPGLSLRPRRRAQTGRSKGRLPCTN